MATPDIAKRNGTVTVWKAIAIALISTLVVGATSYVLIIRTIGELQTDLALLRTEIEHLQFPWNHPESVRWRALVEEHMRMAQSHMEKDRIHEEPAEKAKLIREIVTAVLDERERREGM